MNQFFVSNEDVPFEIPKVSYARFDQCEPVDLNEVDEGVIIFTAVSADWFDEQTNNIYSLDVDSSAPDFWESYWQDLFKTKESPPQEDDPFEGMPLLRYEITISANDVDFDSYREILTNESEWIKIVSDSEGKLQADVYGNLFGFAQPATISLGKVEDHQASVLSSIFDMDEWPDASEHELVSAISTHERASSLAAFDVGQGSASALLDEDQIPWLYHDLGAGVTRNSHTTPDPLRFCWTKKPNIVLSHWDSDHWAGAQKDRRALKRTWIAPRQYIGTTHTAFANDILRAGGRILIWPKKGVGPITVNNTIQQSITVGRCKGNDRNGSCLAMKVENKANGDDLYWLLTGDGGYHQLPFPLTGIPAAIVVPHHGAKMAGNKYIPARSNAAYARLLFSFGPGNAHGRTNLSHPTSSAVNAYKQKGWDTGTWGFLIQPGATNAGGDVLATAKHTTSHLGGVIVGWAKALTPKPRPCQNLCTADIKQS